MSPSRTGLAPGAVRSYTATDMPTRFERQMINRMSWGFAPGTFRQLRRAGGAEQWFAQQLQPSSIPDARGSSVDSWWPDRALSADDKWKTVFADEKSAWEYAVDLAN